MAFLGMNKERDVIKNGDLKMAEKLLRQGALSFVLVKQGKVLANESRASVQTLAEFLAEHSEAVKGASLADKIVGRAVAILSVFYGIKGVFATLASRGAVKFLSDHEVYCDFDAQVPFILNMQGDGPCPIEKSLTHIETLDEGVGILRERGFVE